MGRFFISKTWLEDREIDILEKYDFTEEICESDIDESELWILCDLKMKGFIHSFVVDGIVYYLHSGGYLQHFN